MCPSFSEREQCFPDSLYVTNQYPFKIVSRRGWHHLAYINVWQITLRSTKKSDPEIQSCNEFFVLTIIIAQSLFNCKGQWKLANGDFHTSNKFFNFKWTNNLFEETPHLWEPWSDDSPDQINMAVWLSFIFNTCMWAGKKLFGTQNLGTLRKWQKTEVFGYWVIQ